jgi:hypothetical protein
MLVIEKPQFFIQNESLNFDILKEKRLLKNIEKSYNYRNVITRV